MTLSTPLAPGSLSLRLYPHDLPPPALAEELVAQAQLAEAAGFDGVMVSEHHGGFPNYLPNPLLAANWVLASTHRIWAAPCPLLLPLRPASQVVEDLAWTAQRFPGRVGAGFAVGAHEVDFSLAGVPFDEAVTRFKQALAEVAPLLAGATAPQAGPLQADPAVAALASAPIPAVSAAQSGAAARRAAGLGMGILFDSLISTTRAGAVSAAHRESGGTGPRILVRRAWVGPPPERAVAAQMDRFRKAASERARAGWAPDGGLVAAEDPAEVAARLGSELEAAACDTLNLRVFHAGMEPAAVRRQIELLGTEVVPLLRSARPGEGSRNHSG
jgi:alkanesulfonate monooxygenase SsuD/methylene tetrahydromethanopterin reductase-like flavin-dependent oxidoreductase (luciferase family)